MHKVYPVTAAGFVLLLGTSLGAHAAEPRSVATVQSANLARIEADLKAQWAERVRNGEVPGTVTEPSFVAGKILTPTINVLKAPGLPKLQVTIDNGTVGAAKIAINMTSPSGNHAVYSLLTLPAYPDHKTQTFNLEVVPTTDGFLNGPFGLYTEPGLWKVTGVELINNDGSVEDGDLSMFSGGVNIVNTGAPDNTPPTIGTGEILTPQVAVNGASPYFALKLTVADNLSGVASLFVAAAGPSGFEVFANSATTSPTRKGEVIAYVKLPPNTPTGTYTVEFFTIYDAAGNSNETYTQAAVKAALGNPSFQVISLPP